MFRMTFWNELKKSEIIVLAPILPSSSYCEFLFCFARGDFGVWFISTKSGEKHFSVDRYCRFCNTSCKIPYIRQFEFFFRPRRIWVMVHIHQIGRKEFLSRQILPILQRELQSTAYQTIHKPYVFMTRIWVWSMHANRSSSFCWLDLGTTFVEREFSLELSPTI